MAFAALNGIPLARGGSYRARRWLRVMAVERLRQTALALR